MDEVDDGWDEWTDAKHEFKLALMEIRNVAASPCVDEKQSRLWIESHARTVLQEALRRGEI